ncbi:divergent polysaccharide deacetylase family protein [Desulfobacterota bacterium AH_259_B03_O07]|nr:divergent polysaccharide deacetylase family protein [Desulfobacterota bacterium AH_259_B03_O07]
MRRKQKVYKRKKRQSRSRKSRTTRVFLLTLGFLLFLTLGSYGLYLIKDKISQNITLSKFSSHELENLIQELDDTIAGAFFKLGISKSDIAYRKDYHRKDGEIEWNFNELRVNLPMGVSENEVESTFNESLSNKEFRKEFSRDEGILITEIGVKNYPAYKIRFDVYKEVGEGISDKKDEDRHDFKPSHKKVETTPDEDVQKSERTAIKNEKPKVVIIVDDLGINKESIDELLEIKYPLNFAVLPYQRYSQYAAESAYNRGWDVILHLPMEPKSSSGYFGNDAGDGVLLVGLPKEDILSKLDKNLASVPYIKGVNNHMGSKFTENEELMELILNELNSKGLFFVDSKTSLNTKGFEIAKNIGMKTAQRDVFLDTESQGEDYVKSQIQRLVDVSKRRGYAIGIGHPYPETVKALSDMLPKIKKEVEITTVSSVVN